ncbi:MAG TPA: BlaI/MecI/CopY family transcriptional regulator, partial [Thermoanaerobaculia bacterium]|nr:BlaI/MecI/CopY family transcriptional regulator [Thermoanaerobaculia bacterium]
MKTTALANLSRRERQIMDAVYRLGRATTTDVLEQIPEPPSYSAVRAMLRVLENKGHVRHVLEGKSYVYFPTLPR